MMADAFRPAPSGTAYMQIGMYSLNGDELEPYGKTIYIQIKPVQVPANARPLGTLLGGKVRLSAYQLARNGENLKVTLYWEGVAPLGVDYTIFVHLLDDKGATIAQADHPPFDGAYPTSAWRPGQIVSDSFTIPAKRDAVRLELGLYEPSSGKRLGTDSDNTVIIDVK